MQRYKLPANWFHEKWKNKTYDSRIVSCCHSLLSRLQILAALQRLLVAEVTLQDVGEGAQGEEGTQFLVAGLTVAGRIEPAQEVAEHQGEGQTAVADMGYFSVKGMEGFTVDPYFDLKIFFMITLLLS